MHIIGAAVRAVRRAVIGNIFLWTRAFGTAWDNLSLWDKCIWLLFFSNTIAVVTLLEYLVLGHR